MNPQWNIVPRVKKLSIYDTAGKRTKRCQVNYNECIIGVYYRAEVKQTVIFNINSAEKKSILTQIDTEKQSQQKWNISPRRNKSSSRSSEIECREEVIELKTSEVEVSFDCHRKQKYCFSSAATLSDPLSSITTPHDGYLLPKLLRLCAALTRRVCTR